MCSQQGPAKFRVTPDSIAAESAGIRVTVLTEMFKSELRAALHGLKSDCWGTAQTCHETLRELRWTEQHSKNKSCSRERLLPELLILHFATGTKAAWYSAN